MKRALTILILLTGINVITAVFLPANATTVHWGGVAFSGDWNNRNELYPSTSPLLKCANNEQCLNDVAINRFAKQNFENFTLSTEQISRKEVEALIGIISINSEFFATYQDWDTKNHFRIYRLFAHFILYEKSNGKIIQSVPVAIRYSDDGPEPPTETEKLEIYKKLMTTSELGINFFDEAYKKVSSFNPENIPGKFVQIQKFEFTDKAKNSLQISNHISQGGMFGQFLEGELTARTDGQFVPTNLQGSQVGNRITYKFADGEEELSTPEAVFFISVLVRGAKLVEVTRGRQKTICPAVALTLSAKDALENLTNLKFMIYRDSCGVTSVDHEVDQKYYFARSLYSLLQNIAKQLGSDKPNSKWIKNNAMENKGVNVEKEMLKLKKEVLSHVF